MVTRVTEWEPAVHRLKFILGEYCVCSAWFQVTEITTPVSRLAGRLDENTAAAAQLLERYGAVAIPSHPVSAPPGWLKITRDYLRYVPAVAIHYFIEPRRSFDDYWRRIPRKHRHELSRKLRRFGEHSDGGIDLRVYQSPAEAARFLPIACAVSRRTYQHRLLDVGLRDTAAFAVELCEQAQRGALRGYLLFHRGIAIAYAYGTAIGDCLRFRCIGYDPAFGDLSAGIVLIYEALRSAIGEGRFAIIDFGSGEAQYKRIFATGSLRCATVFLFRPTIPRCALVIAHRVCTAASDCCTILLDRLGVKQRVKQYFRGGRAVTARTAS